MNLLTRFADAMARLPLVAILRGIRPDEATPILMALIDAGFLIIETPLNSPHPFETIRLMRLVAPKEALIGAGTVRTEEDVAAVAEAGGDLIVMPHADISIVKAAKARGLIALPGVATPTEAFAALDAEADIEGLSGRDDPASRGQGLAGGHSGECSNSAGRRNRARFDGALHCGRRRRLRPRLGSLQARRRRSRKSPENAAAFVAAWRKIRPPAAKSLPRAQPLTLKIDAP